MRAADRFAFALLLLLTFTIPWEKSLVVPGVGTIARVAGSLALVGGVAAATLRRHVRLPNLALVLAGLFALWSATTWFWSADPDATVARSLTLLQLVLMSWLVWDLCRSEVQERLLVGAYVLGAVVASLATYSRYTLHLQTYYRRYAAPGFDPNDLALTVALAIPLALWLSFRGFGWLPWLWRLCVVLCSGAVLLTASRTGVVCAVAGFLVVPFAWRDIGVPARIWGLALLALLIAGAVGLAPKESRQRISTITKEASGTLHNRTTIWKAGIRAWKSRKLTGVGAGAYPAAVEPILGIPGVAGHEYVAHNTFLSVLVETGVIGFAGYSAFLMTLAIFVLVQRPPDRALWATVLVVWTMGVATLTWEHRKAAWILFALLTTAWSRAFWPQDRAGESEAP